MIKKGAILAVQEARPISNKAQKWILRIVFFALALWIHGALFFLLSVLIFQGNTNMHKTINETIQTSRTIHINLQTRMPEAPMPSTAPAQPSAPPSEEPLVLKPEITLQKTPDVQPEIEPVSDAASGAKETEKPKDATSQEGLTECSSLEKSPMRSSLDNDYLPGLNNRGHIKLHETIRRDGTVSNVIIEESTMSKKMADYVVKLVSDKTYVPGEIDGTPVDCDMKYELSIEGNGLH